MSRHIVIIEPCSSGLDLVRKAKSMGLQVTIFSANQGDRVQPDEIVAIADRLIQVETNDLRAMADVVLSLHESHRIDAIIPGFEYYVASSAELAPLVGVRGHDISAAQAVRFKPLMREVLQKAGVRVPKFSAFRPQADLRTVWSQIGSPAVLKPSDMSGSMGVRKVLSFEDFQIGCHAMWSQPIADLGREQNGELLLEEYIEGPEYSVEGHIQPDGTVIFLSITEKLLGAEPFFVELGHIVGARLDADKESRIHQYVRSVIEALPLRFGPFHAELRFSPSKGPILMEIGARLAGDRIAELIQLATGFDLAAAMIQSYLGESFEWSSPKQKRDAAGIIFFANPGIDRLNSVLGIDHIEALPGFRKFHLNYRIGDALPPCEDFLGRIGFAIFSGEKYDSVKQSLTQARASIQVS